MPWMKYEVSAIWVVMVASFLLMALWESNQPFRPLLLPAEQRWGRHGLLFLLGGLFQSLVFRVSPVVLSVAVAGSNWGLLNDSSLPYAAQFVLAILLLDFTRYLSHRLFHVSGFLWRIHEIHHSDADYDVSTSVRFHPLELLVSKGLYMAAVAVLAPPVLAVFVSELHTGLVNVVAHANVSLPAWAERWLRLVLITPDLHRIHHADDPAHYNNNFGQTFVFWDRLFGTYHPGSLDRKKTLITGVTGVPPETRVLALLAEPFRRR